MTLNCLWERSALTFWNGKNKDILVWELVQAEVMPLALA